MYIKELNLIINYLQIILCYDGEKNMKSKAKSKIIIIFNTYIYEKLKDNEIFLKKI